MLQNDNLTGRVNELVQEQEGAQHFLRDILLERNAATKDFNSEQELREALTEELKQCNYLKDQATQDYAAEHFKNVAFKTISTDCGTSTLSRSQRTGMPPPSNELPTNRSYPR